mmetsp:Transcript_63208/g.135767  ORF Transcript_63208/g.135767 Transcript_63208/m.135767 type:complete len:111 (+) Transcript_63208:72-404(+)|eukprot:CAMPEP_0180491202 /NCGR_PEP_ID=MMETSP1036_2-20121128/39522_1 /TAXON_ID=632150 /ORGANISM="Azadinium spinosum, Strain 3D9" /LENGTH=110 /DNA_ID=CAMNT_0022499445 /DNA_START=60 /DNA_END=392 /DNA_ORIENTATION=-
MGKKRRADAVAETEEAASTPGPGDEGGSKRAKSKATRVSDLREEDLEERERTLATELREARLQQGTLRGNPPTKNRINWQREVTRANNAVYRLEQNYNEVRRELDRRKGT